MLYRATENEKLLSPNQIHLAMQEFLNNESAETESDRAAEPSALISTPKAASNPAANISGIMLRTSGGTISILVSGPPALARPISRLPAAVEALTKERINRILLVRPAVEAGEKLGFLPGDLSQKIDPYLRPLYDALYEMLGFERVGRLIEKNVIEVAPLAYMRGRTLNNSFIILDESQNTTTAQMKMFLTRIGFGSTAVITGDVTQIDLPGERSGLAHVSQVLENVDGIGFAHFSSQDVVRHRLVQRIVEAYDAFDDKSVTPISHPNNSGKHDSDH